MKWKFRVPFIYRKLFPELDSIERDEDQFHAFTEAWKRAAPTVIALMAGFMFFLDDLKEWASPILGKLEDPLPSFILMALALPFLVAIPCFVHGIAMRRVIRTKINELGARVCIACGHHLEGTTEPSCPKCGNPLEPPSLESDPSHTAR